MLCNHQLRVMFAHIRSQRKPKAKKMESFLQPFKKELWLLVFACVFVVSSECRLLQPPPFHHCSQRRSGCVRVVRVGPIQPIRQDNAGQADHARKVAELLVGNLVLVRRVAQLGNRREDARELHVVEACRKERIAIIVRSRCRFLPAFWAWCGPVSR